MRAVVLTEKAEIALEIALQDRPEPVAYEDEVRIVVLGSYPTPLSLRDPGHAVKIFLDPSRSEEGESDGQSHLDRAEQSGSRARG